jgi:hypothetical protein
MRVGIRARYADVVTPHLVTNCSPNRLTIYGRVSSEVECLVSNEFSDVAP